MPNGLLDKLLGAPISAAAPSGLLTPEDYKLARKQGLLGLGTGLLAASGPTPQRMSLTQRLASGVQQGQGAYQGALDRSAQMAMANQGFQMNQQRLTAGQAELERAAALQQARERIVTENPMPQTNDRGAFVQWLDTVIPKFLQLGDTDTLGKLTEIRKSIDPGSRNLQAIDAGDRIQLLQPGTTTVMGEIVKGAPPRDTAAGQEQREEMTRQRAFTREQQLARQYETRTKGYAEIADKASVVFASAQDPSAAGDLSLIFAYMKMLDPGSVVREGEFATAANAGSVPDRIWGQYNRVLKGERLAASVRADFVARAVTLRDKARARLKMVVRQYEKRAVANGVDPAMVVYDYFEDTEVPGADADARPPLSSFNFGGGDTTGAP